jgi:hypothetical protein
MRKILSVFACFLLVSVYAFADQTLNGRQPREWAQSTSENNFLQSGKQDYSGNTSALTNLVLTGNQATGNASYVVLTAVSAQGQVINYYLWVDASNNTQGIIKFASFPLLTSNPNVYTSFPYGDWRESTGFTSGVKVTTTNCNGNAAC